MSARRITLTVVLDFEAERGIGPEALMASHEAAIVAAAAKVRELCPAITEIVTGPGKANVSTRGRR